MERIKNKKVITALVVILGLSAVAGTVYTVEAKKAEKARVYAEQIEKKVTQIGEDLEGFVAEKDEVKKIEALTEEISKYDKYKAGEEKDEKVIKAYTDYIETGQKHFKDANEKVIADNTVADMKKETQETLKKKVDALNTVAAKVKTQEKVVYEKEEVTELTKKIEVLVKEYTDKMTQLEKEAKEKAKKEAEAKAKKEKEEKAKAEKVAEEKQADENNNQGSQAGSENYDNSGNYNGGSYNDGNSQSYNNDQYVAPTPQNDSTGGQSSAGGGAGNGNGGNGNTEHGWSANEDGSDKHNTWNTNNGDGSWTAGGDGMSGEGGWSIPK